MTDILDRSIAEIAAAVRTGCIRAVDLAQQAFARIEDRNLDINAATRLLADRALSDAAAVDATVAAGEYPGPLAGVPFGVKDLFDVAGLPTTAGSAVLLDAPPAASDAEAIRRMHAAGAVLVATLNMDEFAYGFVTDNARWGITRNPHDRKRFAGGSSGGSAAAVASGMLPLALGSDTNGSIRIPASLCGVFGIKPTHGTLPMTGVYPFVETLDDIGVFVRTGADLALVDGILRGDDDMAGSSQRVAMLGGWFQRNLSPEMQAALGRFAEALNAGEPVDLPDVDKARSAAYLITACEGGRLHLDQLRSHALSYDPATRDRLLAGAAIPETLYQSALAFRGEFSRHLAAAFERYDVLIAPTVYGKAPRIDDPYIMVDGERRPARADLGLYTQPISYLGLPVVAAPIVGEGLPLGVQLIAPKGQDRALIAFAVELERRGLIGARSVVEA